MSDYEVEYGSYDKISFINPENSRVYDSEGKLMLCKCGNPAGSGAIGKEASIAWCSECSPMYKTEANFVYKEPTKEQKIIIDSWEL